MSLNHRFEEPTAIRTNLGAIFVSLELKLAKLGLVREIEAKPQAPIWRRDDAGEGYGLKLTAAGLKAIAVEEGSPDAIEPGEAPQPQAKNCASPDEGGHPAPLAAPRGGSKLALVIEHLQRADGATIVDLIRQRDGCRTRRGRGHRAAQTRVCSDPRTDRRWRFSLSGRGRPC